MPTNNSHTSFQGRLGKDPVLRTVNGNKVATVSVAIDDDYKSGSEWVNRTVWMICEAWGKSGEWVFNNLQKGDMVAVQGQLKQNAYPVLDPNTGAEKTAYFTKIWANRLDFMSRPGQNPERQAMGMNGHVPPQGRQAEPHGDADMGPSFPSEASGMDDVPF